MFYSLKELNNKRVRIYFSLRIPTLYITLPFASALVNAEASILRILRALLM